jgi:hypothetical protein
MVKFKELYGLLLLYGGILENYKRFYRKYDEI